MTGITTNEAVERLAGLLVLGAALDRLRDEHGGYELREHWQQGEFHHDVVVQVRTRGTLPGDVLVIATNCNGGIKEVLCFDARPSRSALWRARCPASAEFAGALPPALAEARTTHWFDPCELLRDDARSELREEHRERAPGGGWQAKSRS